MSDKDKNVMKPLNDRKRMNQLSDLSPLQDSNDVAMKLTVKENTVAVSEEKQSNTQAATIQLKPGESVYKQLTGTDKELLAHDILLRATCATPAVVGKNGENEKAALITETMQELKPQNALEGMLCSQLVSLHCLGMNYLRKSEKADMRCHQDPELNNAIKLLRLQHETIESLMKLRRNGEQKVIVQHVQVADGGQAIVSGEMQIGAHNKKSTR